MDTRVTNITKTTTLKPGRSTNNVEGRLKPNYLHLLIITCLIGPGKAFQYWMQG